MSNCKCLKVLKHIKMKASKMFSCIERNIREK
jgi:hypothetical protein